MSTVVVDLTDDDFIECTAQSTPVREKRKKDAQFITPTKIENIECFCGGRYQRFVGDEFRSKSGGNCFTHFTVSLIITSIFVLKYFYLRTHFR